MAIVNGDSRNNIVNYLAYSKITVHCLYSPSQVQDPQDWQKLHLTDTGEKFKCVVESIVVVVYFKLRAIFLKTKIPRIKIIPNLNKTLIYIYII